MTDTTSLIRIIQETKPHEIYNLAAQSHVQVSFETPEYTANVAGLGTLRLLEAIRILNMEKQVRFYQRQRQNSMEKSRRYLSASRRHLSALSVRERQAYAYWTR